MTGDTTATLRLATAGDGEAVAKLVRAAYEAYAKRVGYKPQPVTADHAPWIEDGCVWVQEQASKIVAVLVLLNGPDGLLIYNIAVAPGAQRKGLGRRLMMFAEEQARAWGCKRIILYTSEKMTENIAFCKSLGYTQYNRLPHPIRETDWVIHMTKAV